MLNRAERRCVGCVRKRFAQSRARILDVVAKRLEPALRLPLEALEGVHGRNTPGHDSSSRECLKSAEYRPEEGSNRPRTNQLGGKNPLPRTGGAPARAEERL